MPLLRRTTLLLFLTLPLAAQQAVRPPDYRAPATRVFGVFVTPIAGAPFTADVTILSTHLNDDGSTDTRTTVNHIARDSSGRIYNERRQLVPTSFRGEPALLSAHIYDPATHTSVFYEPFTHLARENVLPAPPPDNNAAAAHRPLLAGMQETQLGTQTVSGLTVEGTRRTRTVPAQVSTTGAPVTVTDEYWYSPDLSMYVIIHHTDPRSGEQTVGLSNIQRAEPNASRFAVPAGYKLVDETSPEVHGAAESATPAAQP